MKHVKSTVCNEKPWKLSDAGNILYLRSIYMRSDVLILTQPRFDVQGETHVYSSVNATTSTSYVHDTFGRAC